MSTSALQKKSRNSRPNLRRQLSISKDESAGQARRRLRLPAYRPFRFRRIRYPEHLPSVWQLTRKTWVTIRQQWKILLGISVVYTLLGLVFVTGLTSTIDVASVKSEFSTIFGGGSGQLVTAVALFATLLSSSGGGTDTAGGVYQIIFLVVTSLATIWSIRQVMAGEQVRLRDAFYKGMYPLVPFVLVACVILLQTVPFLVGSWLYNTLISNGIAIYLLEQLVLGVVFLALTIVSVYMLCASLFALYIVTLPDMTPLRALRDARHLVRYRRGQVFRKLIYWPVLLLVVALVIMLPVIFIAPVASPWVLFVLLSVALVITNVYMYILYKELLA